MSDTISPAAIERAIKEVEEEVLELNNPKDTGYFQYHEKRFLRMATSIAARLPKGASILDIGSHFLHPAMILSKLGYKVYGVDVPAFFEVDFIQERRIRYDIGGISEKDLEAFDSMADRKGEFDAVLFTEILEHITFNPIGFWSKTYDALKNGGIIYITTPNSLALPSIIRAFGRLVGLRGIGIKVGEIMSYETYGHHWKEYSKPEISQYFEMLSDDFEVSTRYYTYQKGFGRGMRDKLWFGLARFGYWLHVFAPCLETIVKVNKSEGLKVKTPDHH